MTRADAIDQAITDYMQMLADAKRWAQLLKMQPNPDDIIARVDAALKEQGNG